VTLKSIAAIAIGFSSVAYADDTGATLSGITLYGTVDVGVTYQTHGVPENAYAPQGTEYLVSKSSNASTFALAENGMGNSKIGLKGVELLEDGWSALFKVETGFNPASGQVSDSLRSIAGQNGVPLTQQTASADSSRAGQAFNQDAFVGITHARWGTLTFGRQTTLQTDEISVYDPQNGAYAFSMLGYSGSGSGSGATEDLRLDNMVKYGVGLGPLHVGLMYQFAGTLGRNDDAIAADIGGDYEGLSVDAVATHKKGGVTVSALTAAQVALEPAESLAATVSDNTSYSFLARYSLDKIKFYGAYDYIRYANPSSPLPAGTQDIGGYDLSVVSNTAYTKNKILQLAWVGARYSLTPTVELAGAWYRSAQNSFRGNGCNNTSAVSCSGQTNAVSLTVDWHMSKRFDTYVGAMYSQAVGGMASGYLHNNTVDPTAGLRFTF